MIDKVLELTHSSGNFYRDFDRTDADARQLKAIVAAEIIKSGRTSNSGNRC